MRLPRRAVWLSAFGVGVFQIVGTFGASHNQPDRKAVDALAIVLVIAGPIALAVRDRWPVGALAVSIVAADIYIALGYPFGPIFVSVAVALFACVMSGRRREATLLVAAGFAGFVVAGIADTRTDGLALVRLALVAGWATLMIGSSSRYDVSVPVKRNEYIAAATIDRPIATARLVPTRSASFGEFGAMTIITAANGSCLTPASSVP